MSKHLAILTAAMLCLGLATYAQQASAPAGQQPVTNFGSDANGNPLRLAVKTGHISNYDESKVPPYVLPDPLVTGEGERVRNTRMWRLRRTEILRMYGAGIYGRVPVNAPQVTWRVDETDSAALSGTAILQRVVGAMGISPAGPRINVEIHTPANAKGPVPLILTVNSVAASRHGAAARSHHFADSGDFVRGVADEHPGVLRRARSVRAGRTGRVWGKY